MAASIGWLARVAHPLSAIADTGGQASERIQRLRPGISVANWGRGTQGLALAGPGGHDEPELDARRGGTDGPGPRRTGGRERRDARHLRPAPPRPRGGAARATARAPGPTAPPAATAATAAPVGTAMTETVGTATTAMDTSTRTRGTD